MLVRFSFKEAALHFLTAAGIGFGGGLSYFAAKPERSPEKTLSETFAERLLNQQPNLPEDSSSSPEEALSNIIAIEPRPNGGKRMTFRNPDTGKIIMDFWMSAEGLPDRLDGPAISMQIPGALPMQRWYSNGVEYKPL